MNNAVLNEWVPMEADVVIPKEVQFISVDTRDFHWFMSEEMPGKKTPNYSICWSTTDPEHIYFLINELQIRCKDKKWNFLETKGGGYWDLKYIWFKREDDGRFSIWTRNWGETLDTSRGLAALVNWDRNKDYYEWHLIDNCNNIEIFYMKHYPSGRIEYKTDIISTEPIVKIAVELSFNKN